MSAASQTWTIPAGQKYIDKDGIEHVIVTSETALFAFTDDGAGGRFVGRVGDTDKVKCTDGFTFEVGHDPRFTFKSGTDGAAQLLSGEISIIEQSGTRTVWRVVSITLADADGVGANNVTEIVMEQVDNVMRRMTWALVTTA